MPPKYTTTLLQDWIEFETKKRHALAVKYIEENVDLIDTDLQKFMDDCPTSCQLEVCEMLLKAGIDMKDYAVKDSLKQWEKYVYESNPQFHQYYTIDYKQKMDKYITDTIRWNKDWRHDSGALDTISVMNEG